MFRAETEFALYFTARSAALRRLAFTLCGDLHAAAEIRQSVRRGVALREHGILVRTDAPSCSTPKGQGGVPSPWPFGRWLLGYGVCSVSALARPGSFPADRSCAVIGAE